MFDVKDVLPEFLWPHSWVAWWAMFVPAIALSGVLWFMGIPGSGWLICVVTAIFVFLASEFCATLWKVWMRAGMALSILAFVLLIGAGFAASSVQPSGNDTASTLAVMRDLAAIPFMLSGLAMCTVAGVLALLRTDP